jgi:hypothetical protein
VTVANTSQRFENEPFATSGGQIWHIDEAFYMTMSSGE